MCAKRHRKERKKDKRDITLTVNYVARREILLLFGHLLFVWKTVSIWFLSLGKEKNVK